MYLMMPTLPEGSKMGPLINACNFSRLLQVMIETLNKLQGTQHFEFSMDKLGQWMTSEFGYAMKFKCLTITTLITHKSSALGS